MNHNCSAMLAIDPRMRNDSVYQKTFGINDFYSRDGEGGPPLGNIQLLGRVGRDPEVEYPILPKGVRRLMAGHAVDSTP